MKEDLGDPTKRSRVEARPVSTYFDTLVPELKDHVMRHSSETPANDHWEDFVQLTDAHHFISEEHPLHATAEARFKALIACDTYPYGGEGLLVHGKNRTVVHSFLNIAHDLNENITDVSINKTSLPQVWKNILRHGFPKLKFLSLKSASMKNIFPLETILNAHS